MRWRALSERSEAWRERMATGETAGPVHPVPTQRSGFHYQFHVKHHGGDKRAARWNPNLSQEAEFGVFDTADLHDLSDERGGLYGLGRNAEGEVLELGVWEEQVAEFPHARPGESWHGYPIWPLNKAAPSNRRKQEYRPSKAVLQKMVVAGLITSSERGRLEKGRVI
jgi:hypothetical protein